MDITVERDGVQCRLILTGVVDNTAAEQLKSAFEEICDEVPTEVRLDLSGVSTINSTGIGKILMLFKAVRKENGSLEITGISDNLREIFQLTRLDKVIPIRS
ncbi:MAG TPA: STAS domain-containing protein [Acidobacteriota bacterium]|nr:STAS domain-containing protein [Acidobacteriota bacterium]